MNTPSSRALVSSLLWGLAYLTFFIYCPTLATEVSALLGVLCYIGPGFWAFLILRNSNPLMRPEANTSSTWACIAAALCIMGPISLLTMTVTNFDIAVTPAPPEEGLLGGMGDGI